ncbi:MAG: helix-turn-helix domain-containing protein [Acidobacteria bacterium]|nr:helix-turn-helix domain-containing protein [Acidobacteriota bacterium]
MKIDPYVVETLLPDLVGHDKSPSAFLVYLFLSSRSTPRKPVSFSHQAMALETGLSKSAVQAAVRHLTKRGLLTSRRASITAVPEYTVLTPWVRKGV